MRIALAQIRSGTDPAANLELVDRYTREAADAGARLVLFPEATMCRFGVPLAPVAEPLDGRWADGVREIAARFPELMGRSGPVRPGRAQLARLAAADPAGFAAYAAVALAVRLGGARGAAAGWARGR